MTFDTVIQLPDGRVGYVDSYGTPYADGVQYAYVIALDYSWADYIAI